MSNSIIYGGFPGYQEARMVNKSMAWKEYPATKEGKEQLIKDGYMAMSIYEFSEPVEKDKPRPVTNGDLIIDFDAKKNQIDKQGNKIKVGDIATSLKGLRNFIDLLIRKYGVNPDDLRYWASGGKGFHLLIPRELIGSQYGDRRLPEIYRELVGRITWSWSNPELHDGSILTAITNKKMPMLTDYCIDENTFKSGKGQLIRLPHIKRADGNYKVPVTYDEIISKDSHFFEEIVQADRYIENEPVERNIKANKGLEKLYEFIKNMQNFHYRRHKGLSVLETLETECEFIDFCRKNPHEVTEPQWFTLAKLFGPLGEEGKNAFLDYSKLDRDRFDFNEAIAKLSHALHYRCPTCKEISKVYKCTKACKVKDPLGLHNSKQKKEVVMDNFKIIDNKLVYVQDDDTLLEISSAIELVARARDSESSNWAKVFSIYDADGIKHERLIHATDLVGGCERALNELVKYGLIPEPGATSKKRLLEFLIKSDTEERAKIYTRYGWTDETHTKYLPYDLGKQDDGAEYICIDNDDLIQKKPDMKGTLSEWQKHIGKVCEDNPFLQIGCIIGLAGPFLSLVGVKNFGIHLFGNSSSGKSTTGEISSSVNGLEIITWRTTDNGLEGRAVMANDNALVLDEISQGDPDTVGQSVYMLGNGKGKQRANRNGNARKLNAWNAIMLSNGELSMKEYINKSVRNKTLAGQIVRMISIHADAGANMGIFSRTPEGMDARGFADYLKEASQKYRGMPIIAMISLIKSDKEKALEEYNKEKAKFLELYTGLDSERGRVAGYIAFLAACGEVAIQNGVFPWKPGDAIKAVKFCFDKWLENRMSNTDLETEQAVEKLLRTARNNFYGSNGRERGIVEYDHKSKSYFYVPKDYIVPDMCPAYRYDDLIAALDQGKYLLRDTNNKPQLQPWISSICQRKRGLSLDKEMLFNGSEDEYGNKSKDANTDITRNSSNEDQNEDSEFSIQYPPETDIDDDF